MKMSFKGLALLVMMVITATLGSLLRPHISMADERPPINLATMVPKQFGDWHEDINVVAQVINPQQQETLSKIYSQTLSRTYVNSNGYRIMLSIAYGKNQSDSLQLHKPEVCYPAQGFSLKKLTHGSLHLGNRNIPVTRLLTQLGKRIEPVTYWTVVGDHIVTSGINKKLTEIEYAVDGRIPDGMLIRFSSIDSSASVAYDEQERFANAFMLGIATAQRGRFEGVEERSLR